ncbi:MAG: aminotransferase class V-fold PLP-dependent enzyme [Chloroflexota bacterium]|nr:MAG: aminotransferase class V-fold PLP-dependent enzyme [Chloroflexota bacterium]
MDIKRIRAEIPALDTCVYLNTAGIGPSPRAVTDAIVSRYQFITASSPDLMARHEEEFTRMEATRSVVARHWDVDADEVTLLRSTAEGFNIIGHGLTWREGDEIISCVQDHPAARAIWTVLAKRHGLRVRHMDLHHDRPAEAILGDVRALLSARTRLISISHVTSENGLKVPVPALADLAHSVDARLLLDGTQAAGQEEFPLREMGVDFYAAGFYKWALGPFGTGAMYTRRERLAEVEQALVGAGGTKTFNQMTAEFEPDPTARKFEFGARPYPLYPAMAAGIEFLESAPLAQIPSRSRSLADQLQSDLRGVPGVIDFTPHASDLRTGMVALAIDAMPGADFRDRVRERGFIVRANRGPNGIGGIRVCCAFFNTEDEMTRLAGLVRAIAADRVPAAPRV